MIRTL